MSATNIQDPVFLSGLESIVGPMRANGASEDEIAEVTQRAEAFYINSLLASSNAASNAAQPLPETKSDIKTAESSELPTSSIPASTQPPPYPLSFTALASLIATGAPIPGIRTIEDRLAEGTESVSRLQGGPKPWEKSSTAGTDEDAVTVEQSSKDEVKQQGLELS